MAGFFDSENSFWRFISKLFDIMGLSLCFLVCSLPILTLGAAAVALYDAVYHGLRKNEVVVYGRFFRTFKNNFKTATLVTLPALALVLLFALLDGLTRAAAVQGVAGAGLLRHLYLVLGFFLLCIWLLAFATLSRFEFGPVRLLATAFRLTFAHLPSVLLAGLLAAACILPCLRLLFPLPFLPAVAALAVSFFYERIFAPFLPKEEEEEV